MSSECTNTKHICQPLYSLQELLDWRPPVNDTDVCKSFVPLQLKPCGELQRPKMLLCHDMKGGYQNDRFIEGCGSLDSYRFTHWWLIDTFVYFSHHLVTIPPVSWIDSAHKHGVKVLGTFITEFDDGAKICSEMFATKDAFTAVADQLIALAKHYNFDGWLLNIENAIQVEQVSHMLEFTKYMTDGMHSAVEHSEVIWYDSVTTGGELKWQDELNSLNRCFFDACDGIFLNYCWTADKLTASCDAATESRCHDVYVGCDVFGRGCFGGGEFNTCQAVEAAVERNLSVALFAPAWTLEVLGEDNFVANNQLFWEMLERLCPHRSLTALPLRSNFCQGWGQKYFINGQLKKQDPWTNLSLQQVQPTELCRVDSNPSVVTLSYDTTDSFNGGGCLCLRTAIQTSASRAVHCSRVFEIAVSMDCDVLLISYTFKSRRRSDEFAIQLTVRRSTGIDKTRYCLVGVQLEMESQFNNTSGINCDGIDCDVWKRCLASEESVNPNDWITRKYRVEGLKDCQLHDISAILLSTDDCQKVLLGQLCIVPVHCASSVQSSDVLDNTGEQQSLPDIDHVDGHITFREDSSDAPLSSVSATTSITSSVNSDEEKVSLRLDWAVSLTWVVSKHLASSSVGLYHLYALLPQTTNWCFIGVTPYTGSHASFTHRLTALTEQSLRAVKYKVDIVLNTGRTARDILVNILNYANV